MQLSFEHMLCVEGRALVLDSLNTCLELGDLVADLLFKTVDVPFIVLNLDLNLLLEGFHVFAKEPLDDALDLPLVDFLRHLGLFDVHVQLVV